MIQAAVWPAADAANLTTWWDEGISAREIGRRLGYTETQVMRHRKRIGLANRPLKSSMAPMIGRTFGRLTVHERVACPKEHTCAQYKVSPWWRCTCECGKEKIAYGPNLRKQQILSCGCLQRERATVLFLTRNPASDSRDPLWQEILQDLRAGKIRVVRDARGRARIEAVI